MRLSSIHFLKTRDFDGRAARRIFCEILRPQLVIGLKILFHVRKVDRDIEQVIPGRARGFQNVLHVLEHAVALGFDVIGNDVLISIERDTRDFRAAALARAYAREKQQVSGTPRMGIGADGLWRLV